MKSELNLSPDYLFEVSWEVCNKVGGIHTVIATKALHMSHDMENRHILIGPDAVSYTHLRAHETVLDLVCRLLLEKKKSG